MIAITIPTAPAIVRIQSSAIRVRREIVVFKTPELARSRCGAGGTFVKRLIGLPGAIRAESGSLESFSGELGGGLEYPQYTRPAEFRGWRVPDVLLSGDHGRIEEWRREQSKARSVR